jgi:hypothetical protein
MTSDLTVALHPGECHPQELAALGIIPSQRDNRFPGTQQANTIF